ncbi:MAG: hypothetical protein J2O48_11380 [Solirubrobacterales bacterium]|nr:hypothetical protein [Solirubrobacterales bacterium]
MYHNLVATVGAAAAISLTPAAAPALHHCDQYKLINVARLHDVSTKSACRVAKDVLDHGWPKDRRLKCRAQDMNYARTTRVDGWQLRLNRLCDYSPATARRGRASFELVAQDFPGG